MVSIEKVCKSCKESKSVDLFQSHKGFKDGRTTLCKSCESKRDKERYAERALEEGFLENRKLEARRCALIRKFNISLEQYDAILESQGGTCAICPATSNLSGKNLAVDHCHETGVIRGILCSNCNTAIGKLGDTEEGLMKALNYLRNKTSQRSG